jgi:pyridoxine 5-phosphate synthase
MTFLSVNINKIATLRNARGGQVPNVVEAALRIEEFGADGITVHPRPDGRHIRYSDVYDLKKAIHTEFNIEGYPSDDFIAMVLDVVPAQVTLVPDAPDAITSNAGWDVITHMEILQNVLQKFKAKGIRTSIFMEPDATLMEAAAATGTDRIELYTESFATGFSELPEKAIQPYISAAEAAHKHGLGINAGHDLNLDNLHFFAKNLPHLDEVSIGHALISDALYLGLENTVRLYKHALVV